MPSLKDLRVVVTGAARPIGLATARLLASRGARVVGCDTPSAIAGIDAGTQLDWVALELGDQAAPARLVEEALARLGGLDALVHCAALDRSSVDLRPLHELSEADYHAFDAQILRSTFLINQAVLRHFVPARKGQIVNLCDRIGRGGRAFHSLYCASQAGILGLSESIAEEVRSLGIRVQALLTEPCDGTSRDEQPNVLAPCVGLAVAMCLELPLDASCDGLVVKPMRHERRLKPTMDSSASRTRSGES